MDRPGSSISSSIVRPPSLAAGAWNGREGEELLIEAHLVWYESHGAQSQDPDSMQQSKCRIFELAKNGSNMLTRRIAIQSGEDEQQLVSYCKAEQIPFKSPVLSNRSVLTTSDRDASR
jgi:hypothetical protein